MAYDEDYLDSGCTLPFDEATNFDGAAWTYITDYVIFVFSLICSILIIWKQGFLSSPNHGLVTSYLFLSGITFLVGGITHHVVKRKDSPVYLPLSESSNFIGTIAGAPLLAVALVALILPSKYTKLAIIIISFVLFLAMAIVAQFVVSIQSFMVAGLAQGLPWLLLIFVWIKDIMVSTTASLFKSCMSWTGLKLLSEYLTTGSQLETVMKQN